MESQNESQEQSPAPDFNHEMAEAQKTGDFDYVLDTAKKSHRMLIDFRDAIKGASYPGSVVGAVAMGLNFLENMIANSAGQISALKQAEKQTREALKKAMKEQAAQPAADPEQPAAAVPEEPAPAEATQEPTNG